MSSQLDVRSHEGCCPLHCLLAKHVLVDDPTSLNCRPMQRNVTWPFRNVDVSKTFSAFAGVGNVPQFTAIQQKSELESKKSLCPEIQFVLYEELYQKQRGRDYGT